MRDIASKILSYDNMLCWPVSTVELLLDLCRNVLFDVEFLECSGCDVYALLLHFLAHVHIFNYGFWDGRVVLLRAQAGVGGRYGRVEFFGHESRRGRQVDEE